MEEAAAIVDAGAKDDALVADTIPSGDTKDDAPVTGTIPSGDTKDAHALTAAHASGKIEDGNGIIHTARKGASATSLRILVAVSVLLAAVAAVLLWHFRGDPLLVVWVLSFLLCFASSLWTYFLTKTMGARVFLYDASGILLAFLFTHTAVSPSTGALVAHLNTHFAACLLGYAVAEHRLQHQGTEVASAALVPDMIKEDERRLRRPHCISVVGIFVYVPVLALLAGAAWLVWGLAKYSVEDLLSMTFCTVSVISLVGIFFTAVTRLRRILISPLGFTLVALYFVVVFVPGIVIYMTLSGVAAMVFAWVGSLGLTGLFGHCLSVLATFKQIKRFEVYIGAVGVQD